jgi:uncharacterized protein YbgA (DUF1722 family)
VAFHTRHKLLIMAHSPNHYRELGRLVARAKEVPAPELYEHYQSRLMEALRLKATPKKNTNVLQHLMGYFKKDLTPDEKQELREIIDNYYQGYVPLVVPITLINHYVRKYNQPYLKEQFYLHPHPMELQLRNHV